MPTTAIICGSILVIIGFLGYGFGLMTEKASLTALIPAAFGFVLEILGFAARSSEGLRKHLMHAAVVVALLGFIMTAGRMLMKFSELSFGAAFFSQLSMAVVCLVFVIVAVRSFVAARSGNN